MKRKIVLNLAISLDGYICDEDGGFDWISGQGDNRLDTVKQIDFFEFVNTCDVVVMGANAYKDAPAHSLDIYNDKKIFVITESDEKPNALNVEFIRGDVVDIILKERENSGKNIFIYGGGFVVNQFTAQDVIDEYIIGVIPVILGKGRKLFFENNPMIRLNLQTYSVNDGIVLMHYTKRERP